MKEMEDKLFDIQKIEGSEFLFIVFSRNVYTMGDYILDVAKELQEIKFQGNVLFDLLLSNGYNDRFYTLNFNGLSFDYKSLKKVLLPMETQKFSNNYYKSNIRLLKRSVLSNNMKTEFIKELRHTNRST